MVIDGRCEKGDRRENVQNVKGKKESKNQTRSRRMTSPAMYPGLFRRTLGDVSGRPPYVKRCTCV